jgi:hypothetical protein
MGFYSEQLRGRDMASLSRPCGGFRGKHLRDDRKRRLRPIFPNGNLRDFNGITDFAEAIVHLKYEKIGQGQGKLTIDDWFIPFRDSDRVALSNYDYRDQDLSASGAVLPPDNNLLLGGGKDGLLYILNRHQLGKCIVRPASPGMQSSMAELPAPDPRLRECDLTVLKSPLLGRRHQAPQGPTVVRESGENGPHGLGVARGRRGRLRGLVLIGLAHVISSLV